jgi:hypothetical protein
LAEHIPKTKYARYTVLPSGSSGFRHEQIVMNLIFRQDFDGGLHPVPCYARKIQAIDFGWFDHKMKCSGPEPIFNKLNFR